MKHVLLVDDEQAFLRSLADGLAPYASLTTSLAGNGKDAVEVLRNRHVDLVVTDLQMPAMDGFELLALMSRQYPTVPVIVMTAFASDAIRERLRAGGPIACLDKPLDLDDFAERVFAALTSGEHDQLHGISLASFLQLLEMERKTCRLHVTSAAGSGRLCLEGGKLVYAEQGTLRGTKAAYAIITWPDAVIEMDGLFPLKERNVDADLGFIIMESFRLMDEEAVSDGEVLAIDEPERGEVDATDGPGASGALADVPRKECNMALENYLQQLRDINGYKASAVMNFTGEVVAIDSADAKVDLVLVGATFNDIFRSAHEASKKIGLEATREAVFKTPKGLVVMQCSGVDAKVHVHLIVVLAADGNQALLKMRLDQFVPKIVNELG